jgi:hypothetical protein
MPTPTETAIDRCVQAWRQALAAKRVTDPFDLYLPDQRYAGRAYRSAMPYLAPNPDAIDTSSPASPTASSSAPSNSPKPPSSSTPPGSP